MMPPRARSWIFLAIVVAIVALRALLPYAVGTTGWAGIAIYIGMVTLAIMGVLLAMQNLDRRQKRGMFYTLILCAGIALTFRVGLLMRGFGEALGDIVAFSPLAIYLILMEKRGRQENRDRVTMFRSGSNEHIQ